MRPGILTSFLGLIIISVCMAQLYGTVWGWLIFGAGLIVLGSMEYEERK